jgi:serine/threonine-protein kinase
VDTDVDSDAVTAFHDPLVIRARARVGRVLKEKWRLDVLLGVGGMAAVYAVTHRNGSRAAVKILHTELSINQQVRTRFLREGYVANTVGHDGAVRVTDDDVADDGSAFLVMELLDVETLEDRRLRLGGKLSEDDVLSVADQLLDVLIAAHAKGVVHRDLKPENVFTTRTGVVKVLDFGIARLRELSTASTATRAGASMGTPAYMPPEQARGLWDEVDGRSDLWAVGATMFHLLTGQTVHGGRTANEQLLEAMTKQAPPLASVVPGVSPAVAHVVDRALTFEREKRWLDAARMQEAVRRAYHDRNGVPISTAPRLTVPEEVPNRTLPSAGGAIAPALPTTGQPVANSRGGWTEGSPSGLPRSLVVGLVVGGAVALGVVIAAVAVVVTLSRSPTTTAAVPSQAMPSASAPAAPPPASVAPASSTSPPDASTTAAPSATVAKPAPIDKWHPAAQPRPTAPSCDDNPFYTDPNGHLAPRPECLKKK